MRYKVRQKLFSIRDRFTIQNEQDQDVLYVKSQFFSIGKKLRIFDMMDNEVCFIEQKLFRFMPEYNIFMNGQHVANIKKKLRFLKNEFEIQSSIGTYIVQGNIFAYEFDILKDGYQVASISKKFFSFRDTYGIDVVDNENHVLIVAIAIIVDMIFHNDKNN